MRKLSLLFAAAMMACVFQTAYAAEDAVEDENSAYEQQDDSCRPGMRCFGMRGGPGMRGPGPRGMGMWRGGPGHGPDMPGMHRGMRDGMRDGMRGDGPGRGSRLGFDGGMNFGMISPRFIEELELTADQRSKLIDAATENFRERLQLRWELSEAQQKLRDLNDADTPDYAAIVAANEALGGVQGKLDVARRKVGDQFESILTPEQREKIEQYREDRREEREERGDRRGPGERGPRFQRGPGPRR